MTRRSDRDLPPLSRINNPYYTWRHLPIVLVIVSAAAFGIFNYQKINHSVVNSCLYALRVHPLAREKLGDEIYFRDRIPWIWGSIDSLHGEVDVTFGVKGKSGKGVMRFRCVRSRGDEFFHTEVWTLNTEDGRAYDLMEAESDPMEGVASIG
ncbi:cytochrome oxidase complex assembly protein [Microthyrium microscopicum]|uniref:Cytochrome oxidase complex assembly protein n=1 Tax=Microthyrium microscopicum TaxID=703497 RepID=A0A6A6UMW3_9PEZI|nr:cytochrome oxidase complex assembly protein [Microthyrium microscopicum]